MKLKLKFFLLALFAFIAINSLAQGKIVDQTNVAKHSHVEYEKSLSDMQQTILKDRDAIKETQYAVRSVTDKVDNTQRLDDRFFKWLQWLTAIMVGCVLVSIYAAIKYMKYNFEKEVNENYKQVAKKNIDLIKKLIQDEDWRNKMKIDKKVLVLNKKDTGMRTDFKKVIPTFTNYKFADITNLEDSLNLDYSGFDLVIIENCDDKGYWKLVAENRSDPEEIKEVEKVKSVFIALGNKICPTTALVYYGKQGKGFFPSELVDEDKQHMISYANTPSTLFGNMLDLLKFKDIIEGQQKY